MDRYIIHKDKSMFAAPFGDDILTQNKPTPTPIPPYVSPRCPDCPLVRERLCGEQANPQQQKSNIGRIAALGGTALMGASLLITPAPRGSVAHLAALKAENHLLEERRRLRDT